MQAQIGPREQKSERAGSEGALDVDAGSAEVRDQRTLQEHGTADGIDQQAADHSATRGSDHGRDHLVGASARTPDLEFQVASPGRRVDVGEERGECGFGVFQQLQTVAR